MKKILFLGYGGGHINALIPVIKELYNDDKYEVVSIGINLAADTLRKNKIACKTLSSYLNEEALNIGHPLALENHNFNSSVSYADSIAYYGFSMMDLINKVGEEVAYKIFQVYDRRLFLPVESMKKILKAENPSVVVVTTMHRFEAATILAAKELGIPSVKIEDLVGNIHIPFPDKIQVENMKEYNYYIEKGFTKKQLVLKKDLEDENLKRYCQFVHDTYKEMRPDRVCVISKYVKNSLIKRGHDLEKVIVTGQPAFDILKEYECINKNQYIEMLGLDKNKKILSFMSQPLKNRQEILKNIIEGIRNNENIQLIIKLHPNEDGVLQKMILEELNYDALIIKNIPSPIIAQISDITSTVSSTTGLESACLNRDLIYFNFFNEEEPVPYEQMGIGKCIRKKEDINQVINEILCDKDLANELEKNRREYRNYGHASKNIKEVIEKLIEEKE